MHSKLSTERKKKRIEQNRKEKERGKMFVTVKQPDYKIDITDMIKNINT